MPLKSLHEVTGRCACERVAFTCLVESETVLCSCELCRRSSGSAFQAWVNGSRASLQVEGRTSSWASSDHATRHFCVDCASTLFLFERDDPEVVEVASGTIDDPSGIMSARTSIKFEHRRPRWSPAE